MTLDAGADSAVPSPRDISHLRIAVVSDAAPERNGVGAYYKDLVDHLEPRVAEVSVHSPTIEEGVWVAGIALPLPGDATQKLCFPNFWTLARDLKEQQPDVMIVATPGVYGMSGAFLAARWGIPLVTGFHTSLEQLTDLYWQGSLTGRFFRQYLERSHRYLFRKSARVLVNSEEMRDLAIRMGTSNVELMGTPIPARFTDLPATPYDGSLNTILFAGRLAAEKNIQSVVEAAREHPRISFSIAGDGPLREDVETAAAELANLTFLGWLGRGDLLTQLDRHDMLVLPSYFESFGTIALEAMARQRSVIVSSGAGISNWPDLARNLIVMAPGESLTAALGRGLAMTDSERKAAAQRSREAAVSFNNTNVASWEQLLLDVAAA